MEHIFDILENLIVEFREKYAVEPPMILLNFDSYTLFMKAMHDKIRYDKANIISNILFYKYRGVLIVNAAYACTWGVEI